VDERRRVSGNQEKAAAKKMGAKQHKGSGSGHRRMDMHTESELIECKTVLEGKKQITIKADDLKLLCYHAAIQDKEPVLHIRLDGRNWVLREEE
jgi:Holliday junction resolvase